MLIKKRFYLLLFLLTASAFLIRLEVCRELLNADIQVLSPSPATDMATYKKLSERVLNGEFKEEFYYQPFYYAVFLPVVHRILGKGIWSVLAAQSLISALTVLFSGICAGQIWGKRAGSISAFLAAFSNVLIFYSPYHLIETLQAFWIILILLSSLISFKSGKWHHWGITGFIVSLSILTRGNTWFLAPGLFVAALISANRKSNVSENSKWTKYAKSAIPALTFILMTLAPQLPFAWKNTKITGKISGPSTAAGAVLALGNTPEAPPGGRNPGTGPGPMEYPETYQAWMKNAKEVSVPKKIMLWFQNEPAAFIELQFRKLLLFWDYREIPNNIAFEHQGQRSWTLKYLGFIKTSFILTLALSWIIIFLMKTVKVPPGSHYPSSKCCILIYVITAFWLATAAFYILARFRVPIVPVLTVAAARFISEFFGILRQKLQNGKGILDSELLKLSLVILFSAITVYQGYDIYRFNIEAFVMKHARPGGVRTILSKNTVLYLDNGPISFGSWIPFELKERQVLIKKFALKGHLENKTAKFAIPITCEIPGSALFEVCGKAEEISFVKPFEEKIFRINEIKDKSVEIKIIKLDCKLSYIIDFQRNYARTSVDGRNPGGELVCKMYLEDKNEN